SRVGQPVVIRERNGRRHESALVEQLPEAVRRTGEVMTGEGRPHARVDADEQHVDWTTSRVDAISETQVCVFAHNQRMNFLFKEEPSNYSFETFQKDKKTTREGVRNPVAQKHLRKIGRASCRERRVNTGVARTGQNTLTARSTD